MAKKLRREHRDDHSNTVIGLPYYTPEEFDKQMQYADDDPGYARYQEWLELHNEMRQRLERQGMSVIDVPIDVEEMQKYFLGRGLKNDAANRSQYVARKLFENKGNQRPSSNHTPRHATEKSGDIE
jgi:hypothetical protein